MMIESPVWALGKEDKQRSFAMSTMVLNSVEDREQNGRGRLILNFKAA